MRNDRRSQATGHWVLISHSIYLKYLSREVWQEEIFQLGHRQIKPELREENMDINTTVADSPHKFSCACVSAKPNK